MGADRGDGADKGGLRPVRICLVEDNPGDVFLAEEALRRHGILYELSLIADESSLKKYLRQLAADGDALRPDIILLDINLPAVNGFEILNILRSHLKDGALIPVIAVTSTQDPRDMDKLRRLQVTLMFRKPSKMEDCWKLGELVRRTLGISGSRSEN